jgi:hypothetical protein
MESLAVGLEMISLDGEHQFWVRHIRSFRALRATEADNTNSARFVSKGRIVLSSSQARICINCKHKRD